MYTNIFIKLTTLFHPKFEIHNRRSSIISTIYFLQKNYLFNDKFDDVCVFSSYCSRQQKIVPFLCIPLSSCDIYSSQFHMQKRKPPTIFVRLDFLKCVKIFIFSKRKSTQWPENLDTLSVRIYDSMRMKMWTHLGKSRRKEIVEDFRL